MSVIARRSVMSKVWNTAYNDNTSFFGETPSQFALSCYDKIKNVKKILELGCGQGRDTLFFASKGIEVVALDYSPIGIERLQKLASERNLSNIHASVFDARNALPFKDNEFDAVYSHMFFTMRFTWDELNAIVHKVNRVLKNNGFHFFSVRNRNDRVYGKGIKIDENIYDYKTFQVRFFSKEDVEKLAEGFKILEVREIVEGLKTLYLVSSTKPSHC
jgi:SAM-dependent methyltransferase